MAEQVLVLVTDPDGNTYAVGHVFSAEAALELAKEAAAAGWKADGVRQRISAAQFRLMTTGRKKPGPTPAKPAPAFRVLACNTGAVPEAPRRATPGCPHGCVKGTIYPDGGGPAALAYPVSCDLHGYAVDEYGNVKPRSQFSEEARWWCDGEDCGGDGPNGPDLDVPHVHCEMHVHPVDLLTGRSGPGIVHKPCPGCAGAAREQFPGLPVSGSVGASEMAAELGVEVTRG